MYGVLVPGLVDSTLYYPCAAGNMTCNLLLLAFSLSLFCAAAPVKLVGKFRVSRAVSGPGVGGVPDGRGSECVCVCDVRVM